jgi:hypothetical protein
VNLTRIKDIFSKTKRSIFSCVKKMVDFLRRNTIVFGVGQENETWARKSKFKRVNFGRLLSLGLIIIALLVANIGQPSTHSFAARDKVWSMGTAADYTYDNTKISVANGVAQLKRDYEPGTNWIASSSGTDWQYRQPISIDNTNANYSSELTSGLVGYYNLNETSGTTLADSSGANHPGTMNALASTAGQYGTALSMTTSSHYGSIPIVAREDFTLSFWMKTTQSSCSTGSWYSGCSLLDAEVGGATTDFGASLGGNKLEFGIGNPDTTLTSSASVNDGNWKHITLTRVQSTGVFSIYINGSLDKSGTGATTSRNAPTSIGINLNHTYVGAMDEIHILQPSAFGD